MVYNIYLIITIAIIMIAIYLMLNMCQVLSALSTLIYPYFMTEKTGTE